MALITKYNEKRYIFRILFIFSSIKAISKLTKIFLINWRKRIWIGRWIDGVVIAVILTRKMCWINDFSGLNTLIQM